MNLFDRNTSDLFRHVEEMNRMNKLWGHEFESLAKAAEAATAMSRLVDQSLVRSHMSALSRMATPAHDLIERTTREADQIRNIFRQFDLYNERFKNPLQQQIAEMTRSFASLDSVKALGIDQGRLDEIAKSFADIKSPWVDIENAAQSLAGVSELHALAAGIANLKPFGETLAEIVRADLGDWRTVVSFPATVLTDPIARFDFYRDLGFNDALTDFPAPAFDELLRHSGLRPSVWPDAAPHYGTELVIIQEDEEEGEVPVSNREAYDIIYRLETRLRDFIDAEMTKVFGEGWEKRQTPTGMYQDWKDKKKLAKDAGQPDYPLIAYADFSHYQQIIERGDNWTKVFAAVFIRKTDIQESFTRLGPVRVCAMHSRIVTPDDQLLLNAEAQRIFRALGFRI